MWFPEALGCFGPNQATVQVSDDFSNHDILYPFRCSKRSGQEKIRHAGLKVYHASTMVWGLVCQKRTETKHQCLDLGSTSVASPGEVQRAEAPDSWGRRAHGTIGPCFRVSLCRFSCLVCFPPPPPPVVFFFVELQEGNGDWFWVGPYQSLWWKWCGGIVPCAAQIPSG